MHECVNRHICHNPNKTTLGDTSALGECLLVCCLCSSLDALGVWNEFNPSSRCMGSL